MTPPKEKKGTDSLSKEDKLRLLNLIDEKKRRLKRQKSLYKPNDGQLPIHTSEKKYRFVFSGNGAGKSCMAVHEAMWAALGYNPITKKYTTVPSRVVVILDHPKKVGEQWLPEIRKWFPLDNKQLHKDGKPYYTRLSFPNGSEILFGFHEQPPLAWEGVELSYAIFDEPPPRKLYIAIIRGGRIKGQVFKCLLIGTPISCSWLRQQVLEPWMQGEKPDTDCFRVSSEVNRVNLQEGYLESYFSQMTEEERKVRADGQFFDLGSLALAHLFSRKTHVVKLPNFSRLFDPARHPTVIAIDPHSSKPHHAVMVGANYDNQLFYIKELNIRVVARDFSRHLKEFMKGYRVMDIVCDSAGQADMTGGEGYKSFIQILKEEGIHVRPTTFKEKSDEAFIDKIRSVLALPQKPNNFGFRLPKLQIVEGNEGIMKNIENVSWQKNREGDLKDRLDISNQDFLSCLKYALASGISGRKGRERAHSYAKNPYNIGKKKEKSYKKYLK